jgi:ELWxxDGT repeat protein
MKHGFMIPTQAQLHYYGTLFPGTSGSQPQFFQVYRDKLYYGANTLTNGHELTEYDAVTDEIRMVADVNPGVNGSGIEELTVFGDILFFRARHDDYGTDLWKYNQLTGITELVFDFNPGEANSNVSGLKVYNNKLYFNAEENQYGAELWVLNTPDGQPQLLLDINEGTESSYPYNMVVHHDKLFFVAFDEVEGRQLRSYDDLTQEHRVYPKSGNVNLDDPTTYNDKLFFAYTANATGKELYYLDEQTGEFILAADVIPGSGHSNPYDLEVYNGYLYFSADHQGLGREFFEYNDTTGLTRLYADIWQGGFSSNPSYLTLFNDKLYFTANNGDNGNEVWSLAPCINAFVSTTPEVDSTQNGTAVLTVLGGTMPYTYAWSNGGTTSSQAGLTAGEYTVDITDALGCKAAITVVIQFLDTDVDNDGIPNDSDNCPDTANADQTNSDEDAEGDACDPDDDNDSVVDEIDNCPLVSNVDQADMDLDGLGDACDATAVAVVPFDPLMVVPNPASDQVFIRLGDMAGGFEVRIFNTTGGQSARWKLKGNGDHKLDIQDIPQGFYTLICFNTDGDTLKTGKLVILR